MRRRPCRKLSKIDDKHTRQHQVLGTRVPLAALIHAVAVGEHLNFRHAAVALGVSQSSVSERIRALEETLGVRLFERGHRGVRLTEAGRFFLAHVADGIEQLDYAVKAAGMIGGGACGRIRIGVPTTIATGFLAELLHRYREQWPGVEMDLFDGRARDAIFQVREGRLDVAFVAAITEVPDCHSRPLWTEPLFIALSDNDPRADAKGLFWRDLSEDLFLVRYDGTGPQEHDHIARRFGERGLLPKVQRCDVDRCMLLSMIAADYGITLASEATSRIAMSGVAFIPILDEPEPITFGAVWSPHNNGKALRGLLDIARKQATV